MFPHLTTVELNDWIVHSLTEDEEDNDEAALSISEDLLSDTSLKIPSVIKFRIVVWSQQIDYKTFRRFLYLFPNLVDLELSIQYPLLRDILKYANEDKLTETVLGRIIKLNIMYWNHEDTLTDAQIYYLFPNVRSLDRPNLYELEE